MLRNKMSDTEKEMIRQYIDAYAERPTTVSVDHILREWAYQKENLYKMLGNEFMVSRPVSFKMDYEQIMDDLEGRLNMNYQARNFRNLWLEFFYWKYRPEAYWYSDTPKFPKEDYAWYHDYDMSAYLRNMAQLDNLARNVWTGDTFEVPFPNGTRYKIQHGAKITKAMGKIVEAYNHIFKKEDFEAFRIVCSQALNQKALHGTLTLSIHPLDFMTMSDNNNRWSSCMSWEEAGCYRQGTVEMMNSSMVLVAYLADDEPMTIPGNFKWNSKKWRELIIVNDDIITNILGYPYRNESLSRAAIDLARELAEKNMGWRYDNKEPYTYDEDRDFNLEDGSTFTIVAKTINMYNDFHNRSYHHMAYLNLANMDDDTYTFTYSGIPECMTCGQLHAYFESEGYLSGTCCYQEETQYCDYCEEEREGEFYTVDGMSICEYCYEEHTRTTIDGEIHLKDNCLDFIFIDSDHNTHYDHLYIYENDDPAKYVKGYWVDERRWGEDLRYVDPSCLTEEGARLFKLQYGIDCLKHCCADSECFEKTIDVTPLKEMTVFEDGF